MSERSEIVSTNLEQPGEHSNDRAAEGHGQGRHQGDGQDGKH